MSELQRTSRILQGKEVWWQQGKVLKAMYSEISTLLGVGDVPSGKWIVSKQPLYWQYLNHSHKGASKINVNLESSRNRKTSLLSLDISRFTHKRFFRTEQLVQFSFKGENKEACWVKITEQILAWHLDRFLTMAVSRYNVLLPWLGVLRLNKLPTWCSRGNLSMCMNELTLVVLISVRLWI